MKTTQPEEYACPICWRETPEEFLQKHHLVPRSRKGKQSVHICCDCHGAVHSHFTVKQMEKQFSTLDSIRNHPPFAKWLEWIRKRPGKFGFCRRKPKGRG